MGKRYHRWKKFERERKKKFISENKAQRVIGLHSKDFEKLCVLKGVPPTELPDAYRAKFVNKKSKERAYYVKKDISRILTDDVRSTLLEKKAAEKKKAHLLGRREVTKFRTVSFNEPQYNVDHIILELYPTFKDALQGLDDTLTTIFLYASFTLENEDLIDTSYKCKEVAVNFMNYVITARALRKVFITFKGYYYQAEIQGYPVTWIVPHPFHLTAKGATQRGKRIISTSTIFGISFLQFVNFKLYQSLDLVYPPKIKSYVDKIDKRKESKSGSSKLALRCFHNEMRGKIVSLNAPLLTIGEEETTDEMYEMDLLKGVFGSKTEAATDNLKKTLRQQKLFKGLKFFLGREINRESLTFVIRSAGGEVSWDKNVSVGYSYPEKDETITHQISDRPEVDQKYLTRNYLQPQWVYDSFNMGLLLPVEDYFLGTALPPHLSPFEQSYGAYQPPEMKQLKLMEEGKVNQLIVPTLESDDESMEPVITPKVKASIKSKVLKEGKGKLSKMSTTKGTAVIKDLALEKSKDERESAVISESLMPKKTKYLYKKLKHRETREGRVVKRLTNARKAFEEFGMANNLRKIAK